MTRRERVIKAITHNNTDYVPYHIDFTQQAWEKTARYLNDDDFVEKIGNHIHSVYYDGFPSEIRSGYFKDDFGVIWNRTGADKDIGVLDEIILKEPDMSLCRLPEIPEQKIREDCERAMLQKGDKFSAGEIGFTLFERAWTLTSMEGLLYYMAAEPGFVHELLSAVTDYNMKILKIFMDYDFDGIHIGDDWGQQKGLIMGPRHWREFIKPYLKRMFDFARANNKFISLHSCGDISEVIPDLIDIGLNIYQTFQPEIYDLRTVKKTYGSELSFWGGISTQRLLPFETPETVVRVVKETISIMAENGGYIAAPTHAVPGDVPPENIAALIDLLQNQN